MIAQHQILLPQDVSFNLGVLTSTSSMDHKSSIDVLFMHLNLWGLESFHLFPFLLSITSSFFLFLIMFKSVWTNLSNCVCFFCLLLLMAMLIYCIEIASIIIALSKIKEVSLE